MNALNTFLFVGLPYVAFFVFVVGLVYRRKQKGFALSSLSSQFLEGRALFWGSVPFHVGLLIVFFGHLSAFLFPRATLAWNSQPVRLIILEVTAFLFGVTVLVGLIALMIRRFTNARVRAVTSRMDIVIEFVILAQVVLGCWIALGYRWGASWFAADLSPYLWSVFKLSPETEAVFAMPWVIKLHIVGAFLIILLVPFTRLAHFIVAPLDYLVRPYQQVIWNWNRKTIRDPATVWTHKRPTNN
ncbi:MAG: respiratory nitrate reductase subunit gamma [Thermoanaerobaculia bacterium]|nr:MAG: respiratory nitrate reductase subunit gamma [Thermoanaerobaculia bacterium]MBZ0103005.1 respiratory nitrate reductase subunit gamma [Thermoanaerobaculia bacterium]